MKKKFIILPVVAMLMVCGFSACSQDDDLFEYDLGNDEVATLAKRSMPRNGETITPPKPQDPSREYDECGVTFKHVSGTGGSISVTVLHSFSRDKNGKPTEVKCEYYYEPILGFSIEGISLSESVIPGHYTLVCTATDGGNESYIGTAEVLI